MSTAQVYSAVTGKHYASFDELVKAEANGYIVVGVTEGKGLAPWVAGPWDDKAEARRAQSRMRARIKKMDRGLGLTRKSRIFVRVLWKDVDQ